MNDEYKVVSEFLCCGRQMVIVRFRNAAHVMSLEEWRKVYRKNHQNKWKTKVDQKSFAPEDGYKIKVS